MKLLVVRHLNGIKPAYDSDKDIFNKMPLNEVFEIEYTKRRNYQFHKKVMALFDLAFRNQNEFKLFNRMRKTLIEVAGYYDEYRCPITKEIKREVYSMSYANMDELELQKLYEDLKIVIIDWLGVTNEDLENEIQQYF